MPDMGIVQVEVLGPSIVGGYYGLDNPVAVRKGDYGRLAVQAMHKLFPGDKTDPVWHTMHGYTYHAYNKGGIKMLNDAVLLREAMKVRRWHGGLGTSGFCYLLWVNPQAKRSRKECSQFLYVPQKKSRKLRQAAKLHSRPGGSHTHLFK